MMKPIFSKFIIPLCSIVFLCLSCIEKYDAELPVSETDILVVEGCIVSDTVSTFYLSHSIGLNDKSKDEIIHARLTILGSDGLQIDVPADEQRNNVYSVRVPKLNADAKYSLKIESDGETYMSKEEVPYPCTPIDKVEFNQPSPQSDVNILITPAAPADPKVTQYFRWSYNETWELHSKYVSTVQYNPIIHDAEPLKQPYVSVGWKSETSHDFIASSSAYYNDNHIRQYGLYSVSRTDNRLSVLYSTEIVQRSISKAEYEYEKERQRISSDMGGLFTPLPSVLPTNIRCLTSDRYVLGYVGCSLGLSHYRIFVSNRDVVTDIPDKCRAHYSYEEDFLGDEAYYNKGLKLIFMQKGVSAWTLLECLHLADASATIPAFWPDKLKD